MISFASYASNIVHLVAEVTRHGGSVGKIMSSDEYNAFRDKIFYGQNPKKYIEEFLQEEIHLAMSKPIEKMTKAELEAEYDFVTGEEKVFQSITHARSAVQALIDRGELMTPAQYAKWLKELPDQKPPPPRPPEEPRGFLGGIKAGEQVEEASDANSHELNLKAQDFRDVKGRIAGKYTKKAIAARKAAAEGKTAPEAKSEKKAFTPAASGHTVEIHSLDDVGSGDVIGEYMADISPPELDKVIADNKLDPEPYRVFPNPGVRKMRVTNKLRSLIKKGQTLLISGVNFRVTEEALEKGKSKKR